MKTLKYYILIMMTIVTVSSCKKFVEAGDPKILMITEKVFDNDAAAVSAMTGIYAQMQGTSGTLRVVNLPYRFSHWTGLASDELTNFSTTASHVDVAQNALRSEDSATNGLWDFAYSLIFQTNALFEGCSKSTSMSEPVKKQLMAEARFMRGFWYFYLTNLYGDVPFITSTDYKVNAIAGRETSSTIYEHIVSDLKYAKQEINDNYVALNSTSTATERIRPNKATVSALLSRVYLYKNDFGNANLEAGVLINNNATYILETIERTFLTSSKEAIWQLAMSTPTFNRNTFEGTSYALTGKPTSGSSNNASISKSLWSSFYGIDKRRASWISKATDKTVTPNVDYYYPGKYKVVNSATITESSAVFRLAEQYLIRAEARLKLDNLPGAIEDLDVVRKRAGIPLIIDILPGINKPALLDSITNERRRELFTEWGHRWLDLKRLGKIDEVMTKEAVVKGSTWDPRQALWPLPAIEVERNKNLAPNNPGYN